DLGHQWKCESMMCTRGSCQSAGDSMILVREAFPVNARPEPCRMATGADFCNDFGNVRSPSGQRWEEAMRRVFRANLIRACLTSCLTCGAMLLLAALVAPASAAEMLRVAKVVPFAWTFTPLDIGMQTGIFAKHGLDIEESASAGDAKLQQLLTAGSVDIGIGSGPGMAFTVKGVPAMAVAAMYGLPKNMAVTVGYDSDVKTVDDLKGKKLGVTTVGSLTAWIGERINAKKGWGDNGIIVVPIGGMPPARAAIKTHQ